MRYEILKGGEVINAIIADEEFCKEYCGENGYTYREASVPEPEPELSVWDELDAAYKEGVNAV